MPPAAPQGNIGSTAGGPAQNMGGGGGGAGDIDDLEARLRALDGK